MIKKISTINKLAVFDDFTWDKSVLDEGSKIQYFKQLNIIYGRNYSGKTTLSRILRAFETGNISDKYHDYSFSLVLDNKTLTNSNLTGHGLEIRVFNEDFVRDNLQFIIDPDANINSFAILGDDNLKIEAEITQLISEMGSATEGNETGLFLHLKSAKNEQSKASNDYFAAKNSLDTKKKEKATGKTGIKYNERYGDPTYDIRHLENDISKVILDSYMPLDDKTKHTLENSLLEVRKEKITKLPDLVLPFNELSERTKLLITRKIGNSNKIGELLRDVALNTWVKEDYKLHKEKRKKCAFCGSDITQSRWDELGRHFDEESKKLEAEIELLIDEIDKHIIYVKNYFHIDKYKFYLQFQEKIDDLEKTFIKNSEIYIEQINSLKSQLLERKDNITVETKFVSPSDVTKEINTLMEEYKNICDLSNNYTNELDKTHSSARRSLQLQEVSDFIVTLDYKNEIARIDNLKKEMDYKTKTVESTQDQIETIESKIQDKKRQMNDEEKGAIKVNEYLNNYIGNQSLKLQAVSTIDTNEKKVHFEIVRNGEKAYNMSGGECSLIAFCYFLAKLNDIETSGKKPIIWIDDPISSLDSNHVFFVYSLISTEIANKRNYTQLFISTHNLDFLKYLRRLNGKFYDRDTNIQKGYFLIANSGKTSTIRVMPNYMKKYATEFNYLFGEIYRCSKIETIDDNNYSSFYNFSNNARKFLEIYLFYRYPDILDDRDEKDKRLKMEKFFGAGQVPVIFTERITNEYSHLLGAIERGALPIEVAEMKTVAKLIIGRIKENKDQYKSFLNSINVVETEPSENNNGQNELDFG
jgi:wobble nucleotide-excising tRNase